MGGLTYEFRSSLRAKPEKTECWSSDKVWLIQIFLLMFSLEGKISQSSHPHFEFFSCISGRVALHKIRCFPANKNPSVSTGKEILPLRYSNLLNADFVSPIFVDNTMSNSSAQIMCTNWVYLSVVLLQTCPVLSWKHKHLRMFYSSNSKSLIK